ncbi:hypothetical protein DWW71_01195 [Ruminococcus sp. AF16-50]|uniref:Transposase n=1 Tax=Ruminococcus bicirculans (ex Wegman et al. 2014) TaxID=1160721 RepID=A0AAW5KP33_9FIRM|nr:hypothetical protein [Ruminococcus bicirculans (ex Wegman et al. 2014)]RGG94137.1 hypothetical protein DWW71_01195 [Ruminococcus sp. AF16-50]
MNFGYDRTTLCDCPVVMNTRIEHLIVKFKQLTLGLASQKIIGIDNFKDKLKTADKNIVQLVCTAFAVHRIICN